MLNRIKVKITCLSGMKVVEYLKTCIAVLFILFIVISCEDGLFSSGDTVTREILLKEAFDTVEIESIFEITLVEDTLNIIYVTCGEYLQQYVHISIKNNILYLNNNTKYNWSREYEKIKIEFHLNQSLNMNIRQPVNLANRDTLNLPRLSIIDFGDISEVDLTVNTDRCTLNTTWRNFGYYKIKGQCNYAYLWSAGSSSIIADNLKTKNCNVINSSIGDTYINVSNKLTVLIINRGNVYYKGNPSEINRKLSSSGKLISVDEN